MNEESSEETKRCKFRAIMRTSLGEHFEKQALWADVVD